MYQIYFDDKASNEDWGLITSSYHVGDAEPKMNYIDKTGSDGTIDLTEALTGEVSYNDRNFEATFTVMPPLNDKQHVLDNVRAFLNGRKRKIRIENMPGYYLIGRCATNYEEDGVVGILTITARCEPWKYKNNVTRHDLAFDNTGVINLKLPNNRKRVVPTITNDSRITIVFNDRTYVLDEGTRRYTNIHFSEGYNDLQIIGENGAKVSIEYQEGVI